MRFRTRASLAAVVIAAALVASACAGSGGPRHVAVVMADAMTFEPATFTVKAGETVTFDVHNAGEIAHEFFIGDDAAQANHEAEMKQMSAMGHDHATGVNVEGGQSEALTVSFPTARTIPVGCHEPGHWAAGMIGSIVVQP